MDIPFDGGNSPLRAAALFFEGGSFLYERPEATRYSGNELLDLMGPVETGYGCQLEIDDRTPPCVGPVVFTVTLGEGMTEEEADHGRMDWFLTTPAGCIDPEGDCSGGFCPWDLSSFSPASNSFAFSPEGDELCAVAQCLVEETWNLAIALIDEDGRLRQECDVSFVPERQ